MITKFMNEKRKCGQTKEGFGDHTVVWYDYEIKCGQCGKWTDQYGDVSIQGDAPDEHYWICPQCVEENDREEAAHAESKSQ